jgi:hypothetical protein
MGRCCCALTTQDMYLAGSFILVTSVLTVIGAARHPAGADRPRIRYE